MESETRWTWKLRFATPQSSPQRVGEKIRNARDKAGTGQGLGPKRPIRDPISLSDPDSLPLRTIWLGLSENRESMPLLPMGRWFSDPQVPGEEHLMTLIPVLHTLYDSYNLL